MTTRECRFSPCRTYRYELTRTANPEGQGTCVFIGLNPSTADETKDDPTIRRCLGFARQWGCAELLMTNLFAFRATDPRVMKAARDPVGPDNDDVLMNAVKMGGIVVAAWGIHGRHLARDQWAAQHLGALLCLGHTRDASPRHPLYCAAATPLVRFRCAAIPMVNTRTGVRSIRRSG